ncbi:hypothetical protein [Sulfitobacter sp. JB4-11]|uniref:hypothetical protein n=1 Tax=Sulfitobacter rhodophyticola TaxID=3238304 RepID=UPI003518FC01
MTALAKIQTPMTSVQVEAPTSMDSGMGVEMFSSGSIAASGDMASGGGTALFTTSCVSGGEGTALFTTSCVSADDGVAAGGQTGLFTTSC